MKKDNVTKLLNSITIVSTILFLIWLIVKPDFEPAISLLLSFGALISIYFIENKNKKGIDGFIYFINIRGYNESQLEQFVKNLIKKYFGISNYKFERIDGDWYNVIIESKFKLKPDEVFYYCKEITKKEGVKIYEVHGEGMTFGLLDEEGPPKYL